MIHLYVPVVVLVVLAAVVGLSLVSARADRAVSSLSLLLFGSYVDRERPRRRTELRRMRAAHVGRTHGRFASRTLFFSAVAGVMASMIAIYNVGFLLDTIGVTPADIRTAVVSALVETPIGWIVRYIPEVALLFSGTEAVRQISPLGTLIVTTLALALVGLPVTLVAYGARWLYLDQVATTRANRIETTLPRTVAFIYALSRSGMPFPKVLETLAENREVYGESATEFAVAVRDTNAFGTDIITAIEEMAERTPSDDFGEFAENLSSVLGSGQELSSFLHDQYERYQDEIQARQQTYLELLETFAEIYVTVLVAGPLFFITVLVVIGLVIADTLPIIQFVTYVGIPLGSLAFIVYIDSLTDSLRAVGWDGTLADDGRSGAAVSASTDGGAVATDGGTATRARDVRNRAILEAYDRLALVRAWVERPGAQLLKHPLATLALTVPAALAWVLYSVDIDALAERLAGESLTLAALLAPVDEPIVEGSIIVVGVLSVVFELRKRAYLDIENTTPDFLDRLASVNEAGLTIVAAVDRIAQTDLGTLGDELRRANRDVHWGADVATALRRMADRTNAPMLTRSMALITNAMAASGDISPVLRIAADETDEARALRQERRQQMLTYLVVIYISFFVFLGIIAALSVSFIPAIESASQSTAFSGDSSVGASASSGVFSGLGQVDTDGYYLLFFHVTLVQGLFSGIIAGQLGEGNATDGLKHATFLLLVTYVVFQLL
jgi:flagellar protein FlaJ